MSPNKSLVRDFFAAINDEGLSACRRFVTPDFVWWSAGIGEVQDNIEMFQELTAGHFRTPVRITIKDMIEEGSAVAAEATAFGELNDGRVYSNQYHFKLLFVDGKISRLCEYHDTAHVNEVLGQFFR